MNRNGFATISLVLIVLAVITAIGGYFGVVKEPLQQKISIKITPHIDTLEPSSGAIGTRVTIHGFGFAPTGSRINFSPNVGFGGDFTAEPSSDGTALIFSVPGGLGAYCPPNTSAFRVCPAYYAQVKPGAYKVAVINDNGRSNEVTFTVIAPSTDALDTSIWKTYRNDKYGFEVKYPLNWQVQAGSERGEPQDAIDLFDGNHNMVVFRLGGRDANAIPSSFVGVRAHVADWHGAPPPTGTTTPMTMKEIYLDNPPEISIILYANGRAQEPLEDQILSTFKFISTEEIGELKIIEKIQQQATFEGSGTLESIQFIAKDKVLLRVTTSQGLRVAGILDFSADPPKALVSFEDKAQFSQEEWQHLMQQYGDQAYSVTTYTTNVIRNGVAQSFSTLTKVPENVFLIDYDKATKASVPLSLFPPNMPASLLVLVDAQRKRVQAVAPDAALFELTLFPGFNGTTLVRSSFVKPSDDVNYFSIEDDFNPPPTPNHTDEKPSQQSFVLVTCGGAPRNDCGQPTGQPEPHDQHLAITSWKVDLPLVASLLKQDSDFKNINVERLVVSTAGRLKNDKYFAKDSKRLANLPASQPVIQIVGPGQSSKGSLPGYRYNGPYMIVDAIGGGMIEKGTYEYEVVFYP